MPKKHRITRMEVLQEEQVLLSKERTILQFMSTGLAFLGVGVAMINLFKESLSQIIGYALIIIGTVEVAESIRRLRRKQKEMDKLKKLGAI